jgi:threonine dehydrogenase-like Zn-dependent dehydrogenase
VRRPDPLPCPACAVGEWDMCGNELYTERGIKGRHGYGAELFRIEPTFAMRIPDTLGNLGVLVEPASIVAKAFDHIERIGARSRSWRPRTLLVTGAGPIGLLAALLGTQRQLDLHVFDRAPGGLKRDLVHALGGTYHYGSLADFKVAADVIIECTGAVPVMVEMIAHGAADAIMCLLGLPHGASEQTYDVAALGRGMVLGNQVMVGSVNANRSHYEAAVTALAKAPRDWLARLITRHVPLSQWQEAVEHRKGDIKNVVVFADEWNLSKESAPAR